MDGLFFFESPLKKKEHNPLYIDICYIFLPYSYIYRDAELLKYP